MTATETQSTRSPAEWAAIADLGNDARLIAGSAADTRALAEELVRLGQHLDAVRLLAQLLPGREAVLWAWSCAKECAPPSPPAALGAALQATESWIAQPDDARRRAAFDAAQQAGMETAAGAAGLAVFLNGESLAPAGARPVAPDRFLAAKAAAASVILAAVGGEPENAAAKYERFLMRGFEIARRIHLWERLTAAVKER